MLTNKGQNALQIAIEVGNYFGDTNALQYLIEHAKVELSDQRIWHDLMMFGLNNDQPVFLRLAHIHAHGFIQIQNLHSPDKISVHKAVAIGAINILQLYA